MEAQLRHLGWKPGPSWSQSRWNNHCLGPQRPPRCRCLRSWSRLTPRPAHTHKWRTRQNVCTSKHSTDLIIASKIVKQTNSNGMGEKVNKGRPATNRTFVPLDFYWKFYLVFPTHISERDGLCTSPSTTAFRSHGLNGKEEHAVVVPVKRVWWFRPLWGGGQDHIFCLVTENLRV